MRRAVVITACAIAVLSGRPVPAAQDDTPLARAFDLYAAVVLLGQRTRLRIVDWTATEKNVARIAVLSLLAMNWIYLLAHRDRF